LSKAAFAIGNLAQVAVDSKYTCDPDSLKDACLAVHECMRDENEKVRTLNIRCKKVFCQPVPHGTSTFRLPPTPFAGRCKRDFTPFHSRVSILPFPSTPSVGHLAALALHTDCTKDLDELDWRVDTFCTEVVETLTDKVAAVSVLVRSVESGTSTLSWKQRSTAKKHGRVACNTLALLLKHWSIPEEALVVWHAALGALVKCVESLGTSLDEKVIIAATAALQSVSPSALARMSRKSGLVGNALGACICWMARESWSNGSYNPSGKLAVQVELASRHLMESASTFDANVVLACEDIADAWMEHLYEWMVLNKCSARVFDAFTLALQKPELHVPVTVEHKFAKRAMNLFRNEDDAADNDDEL
jgi:hypothetical protein